MRLSPIQIKYRDQVLDKLSTGKYKTEQRRCLCGYGDDINIANEDRYSIPLNTVLCRSCGLMRSDPYYTSDTLTEFYKNEYRGLYSGSGRSTEAFFQEQVIFGRNIYDYLRDNYFKSDIVGRKVFEIGCGAGGILKYFKDKGNDVYGCDFGQDYIEFGIGKGLSNLLVGDVDSLSKFGEADIIILNHVLEHFPDPVAQLNDIKKILKRGGILYIAVPGIYNIHEVYGELRSFLQNAHVYHYTLKTLGFVLNDAGYYNLAGNEGIRSVFKISETNGPLPREKSADVYRYLEKLRLFKYYYKVKRMHPLTVLVETLRKNDTLYVFSRAVYRRYIKKR